jgi:methylated-DNA-protein-cysteine methyltransferase-like protein
MHERHFLFKIIIIHSKNYPLVKDYFYYKNLTNKYLQLIFLLNNRKKNDFMDYNFYEDVYAVVKLIPQGRVSSYGAIARYLGAAKSSRAVGYALNQCASMPDVPAHRVVNRNGMLTGKHHFSRPTAMEDALAAEGVPVKDDQIQDFKKYYWDPTEELAI